MFSQVRFHIVCQWSPPFFGMGSPTFPVLYLNLVHPAVLYLPNRSNRPGLFTDIFFVLVARWPDFVDRHAGGLSFEPQDVSTEGGQRISSLVRFRKGIQPPQWLQTAGWAGIWLMLCVHDPTLVKCDMSVANSHSPYLTPCHRPGPCSSIIAQRPPSIRTTR